MPILNTAPVLVLTLLCFAFAAQMAIADMPKAPIIQTKGPVIYLSDNLDEKDQLGFCIDTVGRGKSDQLHVHSCKPRGGDVEFLLDRETQQIKSVTYDNLCAEIVSNKIENSGSLVANLTLVRCKNTIMQRFSYDRQSGQIRPSGIDNFCLVSGEKSKQAGPFMSRSLHVALCSGIAPRFKSWTISQ